MPIRRYPDDECDRRTRWTATGGDRGAIAGRREGAVAPPCDADAALRPGRRPRRPRRRARIGLAMLIFALGYAVIAGAARHVRDRTGGARPAARGRRRTPSRPRGPTFSIATARFWRPTCARPRCSASRTGSSMSTRRPNCSPRWCPTSMRPSCASGSVPSDGSSGSSARSRPSSAPTSIASGLPGIGFLPENKRVYPNGPDVSHVIGHVNIDNQGIAGIEKWLDKSGLADLHLAGLATDRLQKPVELAVDLRVQHALRDELVAAREKFKAVAAAGLVTDVRTGEIVAMVSVPDYDPNNPREALDPTRINRLTTGVYEMGSTFKALTLAMALDSGKFTLKSSLRCAHAAAIRQVHHPRLPSAEPHPDRAGDLHLFVQHRHRAHGAKPRRRVPQGVPAQARPARPAAHRVAGKRRAAGAQTLGGAQHGDHRVRPRAVGRAACRR